MGFITKIALDRRSVTILASILVIMAGVFTYRTLPVELFPEVEFPLITVTTFYPSANPEAIVQHVTNPIENAISGIQGLETTQSISSENRSVVLASFEFGTDMSTAEAAINASLNSVSFVDGVVPPIVGRINPDAFPVLQLSVTGGEAVVDIQEVVQTNILPAISNVDGVFKVELTGSVERKVIVAVNPTKLENSGISLFQIGQVLRENNVVFPGGSINEEGQIYPIKTSHLYTSLDDIKHLVVSNPSTKIKSVDTTSISDNSPITLDQVADISLGTGAATSISRTNGLPSIGVNVIKTADANTIDVTTQVMNRIKELDGLPPDIEIITVSNDGPEIQHQIHTLEREAILGLILAVSVVFLFFISVRPSPMIGVLTTLRPTLVVGISIPLSIFTGVLLMSWQGLTLNFMTLGGLAISVGRVVDDSIVVLENIYRNIQNGKERWRAALDATLEVGPAITASTITTIVVFVPLGFIQGLVGEFFFPFALTVSFALIGSLIVALTAVPVLGAYLLKPGDLPSHASENLANTGHKLWMQKMYEPALKWVLSHQLLTLCVTSLITLSSFAIMAVIPVNLFPSSGERFLTVEMSLKPGTPPSATLSKVSYIEEQIKDKSEVYITTIGSPLVAFGETGPSGFHQSVTFSRLRDNTSVDFLQKLRETLQTDEHQTINVREINSGGPPTAGLEISVTGNDYQSISAVASEILTRLEEVEGIDNVTSDVSQTRDEILLTVDPTLASSIGLTVEQVGFQLNQFLVDQKVTQIFIGNNSIDVMLRGRTEDLNSVRKIMELIISGPLGPAPLGKIASAEVQQRPVSISRTDKLRSASITGNIVSENTQAVGVEIQTMLDSLVLPVNVEVSNGGVFQQIAEGFQDIFLAMLIGIILIYLVMVASLGSLRNPFVIITSLPLALIGVMSALAITGQSLGLPAMMGILMLIGIVVTNAIVLISFVEQLRNRGFTVQDALTQGALIRLRPILMTAITTSIALLPLAMFVEDQGGIIGAELAIVVIGGLVSSTFLTLLVVPVVYSIANQTIPNLFSKLVSNKLNHNEMERL